MRLVQIRNKAAPSEIISEVSIRRTKLIENQLDLLVVYIASLIPSELITINLPLNYNARFLKGSSQVNHSPSEESHTSPWSTGCPTAGVHRQISRQRQKFMTSRTLAGLSTIKISLLYSTIPLRKHRALSLK
jgi:hypothetical protein